MLDMGCGLGDDVWALAQLVGPDGRADGVDSGAPFIGTAQTRSKAFALPGEYFVGSIYQLGFADHNFDAARADRVFMHLAEPLQAFCEMRRVVKPGGYVLIHDPDWETL